MNVVAIGLDLTDIPRVAATYQRYGHRFLRRVFTPHERDYCLRRRDPAPHLAARFAAKEAGMKALGTGHARGVLWRDVEVFRVTGPPQLRFHGAAALRLRSLGAARAVLTLSHSETLAVAMVLLLSDE